MNTSHKQPEITAVILAARVDGDRISGLCYGDKNGRFFDGEYITTSAIQHVEPNPTGDIVTTRNSVYKVVYIQPASKKMYVDDLFEAFKDLQRSVSSAGMNLKKIEAAQKTFRASLPAALANMLDWEQRP